MGINEQITNDVCHSLCSCPCSAIIIWIFNLPHTMNTFLVQADMDVIQHLLSSNVQNSFVLLTLFSTSRTQIYRCRLQRNTCVSSPSQWCYQVKDQYAEGILTTNAAIVDVLEDLRLRLSKHGSDLDENEMGRTSLGFRIEWDFDGRVVRSLVVSHVTAGGCADPAVLVGDFIQAVEGQNIRECHQDALIMLLRGNDLVGSTCKLLINRNGTQIPVEICRTRSSQLRDANTLQVLCAELKRLTTSVKVGGVKEMVELLRDHAIVMEKRRTQRELLVSKKMADLQTFFSDRISAVERQLKPPDPSTPTPPTHTPKENSENNGTKSDPLEQFRAYDPTIITEIVSAVEESGISLQELIQFLRLFGNPQGVRWSDMLQLVQFLQEVGTMEHVVSMLEKRRAGEANQDNSTQKLQDLEGLLVKEQEARTQSEILAQAAVLDLKGKIMSLEKQLVDSVTIEESNEDKIERFVQAAMPHELEALRNENSRLQQALKHITTQDLVALKNENVRLNEELTRSEAKFDTTMKELAGVKEALTHTEEDLEKLRNDNIVNLQALAQTEEKFFKTTQELASLQDLLQIKDNPKTGMDEKPPETSSQNLDAVTQELRQALATVREQFSELAAAAETEQAQTAQLEQRIKQLQGENNKLQHQVCTNPGIHDEVHELQDRMDDFLATHVKTSAENRALKKLVQELEAARSGKQPKGLNMKSEL